MITLKRVPLFVLNNFLKFERKIYQVFGLKLGRPLSAKMVVYAIVFGVLEFIIYHIPLIGELIRWMPFALLVTIPVLLGWLLADVGTEGRSPIFFFRSFISYQKRKWIDKSSMYRGREVSKIKNYQFRNYFTFREPLIEVESFPLGNEFERLTWQNQRESERVSGRPDELMETKKEPIEEPAQNETATQANPSLMECAGNQPKDEPELPIHDVADIETMKTIDTLENTEHPEDINDMSSLVNAMSDTTEPTPEEPAHPAETGNSDKEPKSDSSSFQTRSPLLHKPKPSKGGKTTLSKNEKPIHQPSGVQYLRMAIRYRSRMRKTRKKG